MLKYYYGVGDSYLELQGTMSRDAFDFCRHDQIKYVFFRCSTIKKKSWGNAKTCRQVFDQRFLASYCSAFSERLVLPIALASQSQKSFENRTTATCIHNHYNVT
jgi:hypothetical protein